MSLAAYLNPLVRIAGSLERIAGSLADIHHLMQEANAPAASFSSSYGDYKEDGSGFEAPTDEERVKEAERRAKWEEVSGRQLLPWDEPPEDFSI